MITQVSYSRSINLLYLLYYASYLADILLFGNKSKPVKSKLNHLLMGMMPDGMLFVS